MSNAVSAPQNWCWDPMPPVDGWFAVIRCYEVEEGMFPGVAWATAGKVEWPDDGGMTLDGSGHAGPFATKAEALEWAEAHDPEETGWRSPTP
jgi:hypothetical protein